PGVAGVGRPRTGALRPACPEEEPRRRPGGTGHRPAVQVVGLPGGVAGRLTPLPGSTDPGGRAAGPGRQPLVGEGVLTVIRHPARGEYPAGVELQVREARRVW